MEDDMTNKARYHTMPTLEMQTELRGWRTGRISILDGDIDAQHDFAAVAVSVVTGGQHLVDRFTPRSALLSASQFRSAFLIIDHIEIADADSYDGFSDLHFWARDRKIGILLCLTCPTGIPGSVPDDLAVMRLVIERVDGGLKATVAKWRSGPTGGVFTVPTPAEACEDRSSGVSRMNPKNPAPKL